MIIIKSNKIEENENKDLENNELENNNEKQKVNYKDTLIISKIN